MPGRLVKDPIYRQLNQVLRDLIRNGEFKIGDQFLTERQICEQFDVSRATANKALSNLVAEGVLEFKKGVGTFVRGGILDYDLRTLVSFTEKAIAAGKQPTTQVLRFEAILAKDATTDLTEKLRVQPDDPVYYNERLRLANDIPVILEHRYIAAGLCPGLTEVELAGSLYALFIDKYHLDVTGADQIIRAMTIRGAAARLLRVEHGTAGLLVISVGYVRGNIPLWWEHTLYRGDAYVFHNRLGPVQTARPAAGTLLDFEDQAGQLPDSIIQNNPQEPA